MLKFLLFMLAFFWIGRLLVRLVLPTRRPPRDRHVRGRRDEKPRESLRDLTQQEISDADYEEIPPDEENPR